MSSCIEIDDMFRLFRFIVATYHIKVEISLDLRNKRASLYKIFRTEQSLFFSVPKGKDYISLRLLSACKKCPGNLQYSRDTGSIVIRAVINLISVKCRVYPQMVKVSAYDDIFLHILTGNHSQYVPHR